jgi:hypothetical protein
MDTRTSRTFARARTAVAALALAIGCTAVAGNLTLNSLESASTEGLGSYDGVLCYTPTSATTGELTITLTNNSPADNGGYLTGFVFNFESSDPDANAILVPSAGYPFEYVEGKAPPFGKFMAGAALDGKFNGGGNPTDGIPVGETGTFTFIISANDAVSLNSSSFGQGDNDYNFVVRFKGFCDGGSDKVPGIEGCPYTGPCDLNGSGTITYADVEIVLANWGAGAGNIADVNSDGIVDGFDLAIVLECWRDCSLAN